MTAIDVAAPTIGSIASPRLRLTVRGRRVLAALASLPAVVALSIAVISGGGAIASDSQGAAADYGVITVMSGDSLWVIAERIAPSADPRDVVDDIIRLNALGTTRLEPGQSLSIPAQYAD